MRVEDLRKIHQTRPFQPFKLRVADGREYPVEHPEFLLIPGSGRSIVLWTPDDVFETIDVLMITSIHCGNGKARRRKRA